VERFSQSGIVELEWELFSQSGIVLIGVWICSYSLVLLHWSLELFSQSGIVLLECGTVLSLVLFLLECGTVLTVWYC
jgi:hypothetical protein